MKNATKEIPSAPVKSGIRPSRKILRDEMQKRMEAAVIQPPTSIKVLLDVSLNRHIEFARDKAEADGKPIDDDEIRHHEESRVVTAWYKDAKQYLADITKNHAKWLWHRDRTIPSWMQEDLVISDILDKTFFWEILTALFKHSKPIDDQHRSPIYFIGSSDLYKKIATELGISRISVQLYVRAFCEMEVIRQMDKKGLGLKANARAYQIAYVNKYKDGTTRNLLLIKKMRKRIREFKVTSGKE
jgi:hypothetical protein